jgi:hypothetical protein
MEILACVRFVAFLGSSPVQAAAKQCRFKAKVDLDARYARQDPELAPNDPPKPP